MEGGGAAAGAECFRAPRLGQAMEARAEKEKEKRREEKRKEGEDAGLSPSHRPTRCTAPPAPHDGYALRPTRCAPAAMVEMDGDGGGACLPRVPWQGSDQFWISSGSFPWHGRLDFLAEEFADATRRQRTRRFRMENFRRVKASGRTLRQT